MTPVRPAPGADGLRHGALQTSGLPARILGVLRASGMTTLSDLCGTLPAAEKLDADDRALLARVAAYACAACESQPPLLNLREWLALFLLPRLADVVRLHFAMDEPASPLTLHEARLRDTGFKLGVTRERARQLLELAFATLRQALPLRAAEPLYRTALAAVLAAGGILDRDDLARNTDPAWGGASPAGSFLLLHHLVPGRLTLYRDCFCSAPASLVERVENALREILTSTPGLLSLAEIAARLPKSARMPGIPSAEPLLLTLCRHLPDVLLTRDRRAGLASRGGSELLVEILAAGEAPLRTLVTAFNERLYPECRRGSGYVRDALQRDPRILKTAPNRYALPGGLQTNLPLGP